MQAIFLSILLKGQERITFLARYFLGVIKKRTLKTHTHFVALKPAAYAVYDCPKLCLHNFSYVPLIRGHNSIYDKIAAQFQTELIRYWQDVCLCTQMGFSNS